MRASKHKHMQCDDSGSNQATVDRGTYLVASSLDRATSQARARRATQVTETVPPPRDLAPCPAQMRNEAPEAMRLGLATFLESTHLLRNQFHRRPSF